MSVTLFKKIKLPPFHTTLKRSFSCRFSGVRTKRWLVFVEIQRSTKREHPPFWLHDRSVVQQWPTLIDKDANKSAVSWRKNNIFFGKQLSFWHMKNVFTCLLLGMKIIIRLSSKIRGAKLRVWADMAVSKDCVELAAFIWTELFFPWDVRRS